MVCQGPPANQGFLKGLDFVSWARFFPVIMAGLLGTTVIHDRPEWSARGPPASQGLLTGLETVNLTLFSITFLRLCQLSGGGCCSQGSRATVVRGRPVWATGVHQGVSRPARAARQAKRETGPRPSEEGSPAQSVSL